MRTRALALLSALLIGLWPQTGAAAKSVKADVVVDVAQARSTHRFAETFRVEVKYGAAEDSLGFVPAGPEREAVGPAAFDVDASGAMIVADPVRQKVFRVQLEGTAAAIAPIGPLALPFSDVAVDRDGLVYVADARTRRLLTVTSSPIAPVALPEGGHDVHFARYGRDLVLRTGDARSVVRRGVMTSCAAAVQVEQYSGEAALVTMGATGRSVKLELGGPLASIRLIGVNDRGDAFVVIEQFRQRGRLDVDRRVVVVGREGGLVASMDVTSVPVVHPVRDFVLGPQGALYRMVPGATGVTFQRWEVRP